MNLILYKIIAAVLIFFTSIITVIYPLLSKKSPEHAESFELGEAFASGIFLGVAFFHMLPSSINIFYDLYGIHQFPFAEAITMFGFMLLLFLERLSLAASLFNPRHTVPFILTIILLIHALTEGAALGIGVTFTETLMIFIAIIAHKGSASFALCVTLMRYQLRLYSILAIILVFSLMTPLGIVLGTMLSLSYSTRGLLTQAIFNSFAAGTFIYISTLHHIRFHERKDEIQGIQGMLQFGFLFVGLVAMAIISIWV